MKKSRELVQFRKKLRCCRLRARERLLLLAVPVARMVVPEITPHQQATGKLKVYKTYKHHPTVVVLNPFFLSVSIMLCTSPDTVVS